ncbi:JAB domain-containing protein [Halomonas jincaotanensis]
MAAETECNTQRLKEALGLVDIRAIAHIVVGGEGCTSFAELGYLYSDGLFATTALPSRRRCGGTQGRCFFFVVPHSTTSPVFGLS